MPPFEYNDGGRRQSAGHRPPSQDCAVRALSLLTGCGYDAAFAAFASAKKEHLARLGAPWPEIGDRAILAGGVEEPILDRVYRSAGLSRRRLRRPMTYAGIHRRYGDCIVCIPDPQHAAAIVGGAVLDTVDTRRDREGRPRTARLLYHRRPNRVRAFARSILSRLRIGRTK